MPEAAAIPLFDPAGPLRPLRDELRAAVDRVLDSERYVLGPEVAAFEEEYADWLGVQHAIGVANGTEAITIALRALDVGPGDEVIVPSFTFFASAEAVPPTGADVVFCDVDPETYVVTPEAVEAVMTSRTKAVIAVHLFGNVAPVAAIEALGVPVVEDAAQSGGTVLADGTRPGALGAISTSSFYPSKNLGAFGDGGVVCTSDAGLADRVRMLRFHGSYDKVTYEHVGYNSRLDELQAAILRVQLPHLDGWAAHRRAAGDRYATALAEVDGVGVPRATDGAAVAWHVYALRAANADDLIAGLRERGVESRAYYRVPVHLQPVFARTSLALPGTAVAAREHLAVPISASITDAQVDAVVEAVTELCGPGST